VNNRRALSIKLGLRAPFTFVSVVNRVVSLLLAVKGRRVPAVFLD
jgi:hypothetical protein